MFIYCVRVVARCEIGERIEGEIEREGGVYCIDKSMLIFVGELTA
jgi:hypothetical protein